MNNRNNYWKNIVNKTEYEIEILFDDLSWEDACEKEKEFIKLYGRKDLGLGPLVNMTDGGEGVCGIKKDAWNKGKKGLQNHTEETKKKIGKASKGNTHMIGKKRSEESKNKQSETRKGMKMPLIKCPNCGKEGGGGAMYQHHFNNCKKNI